MVSNGSRHQSAFFIVTMTGMLLELKAWGPGMLAEVSLTQQQQNVLPQMPIELELINTALDYNESTKVLTSKT